MPKLRRERPIAIFSDDLSGHTLTFGEPKALIVAERPEEVLPALQRMEDIRAAGHWMAGYMSYEAGFLLDPVFDAFQHPQTTLPYLCFGVFDKPKEQAAPSPIKATDDPFLSNARPEWDFSTYRKRFDCLHAHLHSGDCYQGNLTFVINARWSGDPIAGFQSLSARQPVRYAAYIDLYGPRILSRSPELFFHVDSNGFIETHPMKGTAPRGATKTEDEKIIAAMSVDEKTRAENCMIVDLLRNDISRISHPGTVQVPRLFEIETYPTLHQMVSSVRAKLLPNTTIQDIFTSLFPCGSITGAPKISAMKILNRLEDGPRGAYCGAIGTIAPTGEMRFNVAIRTLTLHENGRAVFNVGGGIVLDSTAEAEYEEALLKARFALSTPLRPT